WSGETQDYAAAFVCSPAEITGVGEHRIDDQLAAAIIAPDCETDPLTLNHKMTVNGLLFPADLLVNARRIELNRPMCGGEDKVSATVDPNPISALELQRNTARIRARRDLKVVFQLPLAPVVNQINTGINLAITHASELRHSPMPVGWIFSDQVIAL